MIGGLASTSESGGRRDSVPFEKQANIQTMTTPAKASGLVMQIILRRDLVSVRLVLLPCCVYYQLTM
jgi:hypothetical protein